MSLISDLTTLRGVGTGIPKQVTEDNKPHLTNGWLSLVETDIKILTMKNEGLDGLVKHFQTILLFRSQSMKTNALTVSHG